MELKYLIFLSDTVAESKMNFYKVSTEPDKSEWIMK